jgi:dipeptidyl aminopeptidase/acylaminoacyl peptidase
MSNARRFAVLAVTLAVCLAAHPGAGAKRPVSIDDSLHMRGVMGAQIAPDGSAVLFMVRGWEWPGDKVEPDKGTKAPEMRSHIWKVATSGSEPARQITFGERGESSPAWSPDGKYISFVATRGAGTPTPDGDGPRAQIWLLRTDGGEAWQLTEAKEGVGTYEWSPDGKSIAYLGREPLPKEEEEARRRKDDERVYEGDFRMQHIWTIDVESKKTTQVTSGTEQTVRSMNWAPDGARIVFSAGPTPMTRDERQDIFVVTVGSKAIEKIAATPALESAPRWSPDGKTIAYSMIPIGDASTNQDGLLTRPLFNSKLMLYDVAGKRARDVSDPKFDHSVSSVVWSPDSKRVLFSVGDRVYRSVVAYSIDSGQYTKVTSKQMISFGAGSLAKDGSKVAFTMDSATAPADVYVAGSDFASPKKLTSVNPQAADFEIGETEVLTWKTADGWESEGVLVKPVGYQPGKRYPLLVDVHGGPTGAHTNGFKVGVHNGGQLWAGKGWAVLYPNPRGSSNYGEKFMRGNIPDWGGGDYRDIMAGVDEVIKRGVADPEKLAVMGWSYGGYMTCWIVSQTGRFKAARMGAGLSNIHSMYGTTDIPGYIGTFFNNYPNEKTLKLYAERSGLTYAHKVTTPLLIMHGLNDERVPIGQPMEFYRALKDRGKIVELVWYPREGHSNAEYYHQRDQIRRELEWMTKYTLGGRQSTSESGQ